MSISVVIPVFNDVKYIKNAINSVLAQNEVSEIVLVDDGSTDGSLEVCIEFEKNNEKVRFYSHHKSRNLGAAASRNLGIEKSSRPYIAFLDADDYYIENRFKKSYGFLLNNPEVDMVYEPTLMLSEDSKAVEKQVFFTENRKEFSKFECYFTSNEGWIHLNSTIFKRSAFKSIGLFNMDVGFIEDTDLLLRAMKELNCVGINRASYVAVHRIHNLVGANFPENRRKHRILLYRKWYRIIIQEKHHPAFVRQFLNKMVFYNFDAVYFEHNTFLRKVKKLLFLAKMIFQDPRLLFKII